MVHIGRVTGAGLWVLLTMAPGAHAEVDCFAASDAVNAGRWVEAEAMLRERLRDSACRPQQADLTYSLAYVTEQRAAETPSEACRAERLYRRASRLSTDSAVRTSARNAIARTAAICARSTGAPRRAGTAEPDTDPLAWGLAGGALAAAVAGAALLYLGVAADDERAEAEALWVDPATDDARADRARRDFDDAAGRATGYGIGGWAALAVGVGLGAAAAWVWLDDDALTVTPTLTGLGVTGRF